MRIASMIMGVSVLAAVTGAASWPALALPGSSGPSQASPEPAPLPSVSLPPELDRVLRDYEKAWEAGDSAALAALFTEDGFVLSNGAPPVRGREAIRAAYASTKGALRLRALASSVDGALGYIIGAFRYGTDPGLSDKGKFVLALRRPQGGAWLIAADIDNSNRRTQ